MSRTYYIYQGNVKKMTTDKLEVVDNNVKRVLKDEVVLKDLKFYQSRLGRFICFKYDTYLPDRMEALDYVQSGFLNSVLFVDYEELKKVDEVDKKTFKLMKKDYKNKED